MVSGTYMHNGCEPGHGAIQAFYHISKNLNLKEGFIVPHGIILHEYSCESQLTGNQTTHTKAYEPPN
jgi:hypothetical protein